MGLAEMAVSLEKMLSFGTPWIRNTSPEILWPIEMINVLMDKKK